VRAGDGAGAIGDNGNQRRMFEARARKPRRQA